MADEVLTKAINSLERVQKFDTATLSRVQQLGEDLNLIPIVDPAGKVITLFNQIPSEQLNYLPNDQLNILTSAADGFYNLLQSALQFKSNQNDALNVRANLINNFNNQYQPMFSSLFSIIAYLSSRSQDFAAMGIQFRSTMQRATDEFNTTFSNLSKQREEATNILEEVRKVAAEQGVSQQASYFNAEGASHEKDADRWRVATLSAAGVLVCYAIISAFFHKIPILAPQNNYDAFQLGISKVLVFTVLGYMLILFSRNFLAHKHNLIINRHRQNALLTFKALADAAGSQENRDVVLTYAAACIFSPQDTGYMKSGSASNETPMAIIPALSKMASGGSSH